MSQEYAFTYTYNNREPFCVVRTIEPGQPIQLADFTGRDDIEALTIRRVEKRPDINHEGQ